MTLGELAEFALKSELGALDDAELDATCEAELEGMLDITLRGVPIEEEASTACAAIDPVAVGGKKLSCDLSPPLSSLLLVADADSPLRRDNLAAGDFGCKTVVGRA